ncbi:hypothetical protein LXL04_028025 [Taraxacum kok-saghyz]
MSKTNTRNHHHHNSSKTLKEMAHKLLNTPPYSNIYFVGDGFERLSPKPKENVCVTNYYDVKKKNGLTQNEEDINANVDAEALDFIKLRHKQFEPLKFELLDYSC